VGSPCLEVTIARLLDHAPRKCSDLLQGGNVLEHKRVPRSVVQRIERLLVPTCLDGAPRSLSLVGKHSPRVRPFVGRPSEARSHPHAPPSPSHTPAALPAA